MLSETLAGLRPLLGELNDLKRIGAAMMHGSLAEQGFARSWGELAIGKSIDDVARRELGRSLAAARLGAIDAEILRRGGMSREAIRAILERGVAAATESLPPPIRAKLMAGLVIDDQEVLHRFMPPFVSRLAAQPRAGATRPGRPRLMLEPPENHAEHCYMTALYAALVAVLLDIPPGRPFLAGLCHHLHNAEMPDSGFTGEEILGKDLAPLIATFTKRALPEVPPALKTPVAQARALLDHARTPEAQCFHAGDVFDRVLQMDHYARVAAFELRQALDDLELVHPGPLQAFQLEALAAAGIWP